MLYALVRQTNSLHDRHVEASTAQQQKPGRREVRTCAACAARPGPVAVAMPSVPSCPPALLPLAMPLLLALLPLAAAMTARTSAKSTFTRPGTQMMSLMPCNWLRLLQVA